MPPKIQMVPSVSGGAAAARATRALVSGCQPAWAASVGRRRTRAARGPRPCRRGSDERDANGNHEEHRGERTEGHQQAGGCAAGAILRVGSSESGTADRLRAGMGGGEGGGAAAGGGGPAGFGPDRGGSLNGGECGAMESANPPVPTGTAGVPSVGAGPSPPALCAIESAIRRCDAGRLHS
jgi:hypothetical protein